MGVGGALGWLDVFKMPHQFITWSSGQSRLEKKAVLVFFMFYIFYRFLPFLLYFCVKGKCTVTDHQLTPKF